MDIFRIDSEKKLRIYSEYPNAIKSLMRYKDIKIAKKIIFIRFLLIFFFCNDGASFIFIFDVNMMKCILTVTDLLTHLCNLFNSPDGKILTFCHKIPLSCVYLSKNRPLMSIFTPLSVS